MQTVQVGNEIHNFPDDATPEMIAQALGVTYGDGQPQNPPMQNRNVMPTTDDGMPRERSAADMATSGLTGGTPEENRSYLTNLAMTAIPPLRVGKYLPEGYNVLKALANYGVDIGQNAALGGAASAIEGGSPTEGAAGGAVGAAVANPLVSMVGSGNPLVRLAGAGGVGLLGAAAAQQAIGTDSKAADVAGAGLGAAIGLRGKNARDLAVMNLLKNVDLKEAMPKIQAAERIGLKYITPAEATGSGYIGAIEGTAGTTPEGALMLEKQAKQRKQSEKTSVLKLYDTVFKDNPMSKQVDTLYKSAYQASVSPQFYNQVTKSNTISAAMNRVDNNPIYKDELKGVPKTSFAYLDQVKRAMDDMITEVGAGTNEARIIANEQRKLVKKMDSVNSTYKAARSMAEREIVKNKLQNAINKDEIKGQTFFNKVLKNDNKFEEYMFSLRNVPAAQSQMKDMRMVFKDLIDYTQTPRTAAKLTQTSMSNARSAPQWTERFLHKLQGGEYDKAMVELMTDPKWHEQVIRAKEMAVPSEKVRAIANAISRVTGRKLTDVIGGE